MSKKSLLSAVLALSLGASLTACAGLPNGVFGGLTANLNPQQQAAVKSMVNDYLVASQMNQDMSDFDAMTDSGKGTQALNVGASARVSASHKLQERAQRFKERSKPRLEHKRGAMKGEAKVTVSEDGTTVTKTMEFQHKNGAKKQTIVKIYADDTRETLIEANFHLEQEHRNGMNLVVDRSRKLGEDGSWTITYHATFTRKDGKEKTVAWTRVEAEDGSQTGTGTLTRFDGTVVQITFTKSADGLVVTRTIDGDAKVEAVVSQDEASADAEVTVKDGSNGQVTGKATVNIEDAEPSNQ
ncbi:hypothetical protein D3C87_908490 [compost metagenome]